MVDAIRLVARAHTDCYPSPDLKLGLLRCLSEYQPTGVLPCRLLGPLLDGFGQVRCVGVHLKAAAKIGNRDFLRLHFLSDPFLLFLFYLFYCCYYYYYYKMIIITTILLLFLCSTLLSVPLSLSLSLSCVIVIKKYKYDHQLYSSTRAYLLLFYRPRVACYPFSFFFIAANTSNCKNSCPPLIHHLTFLEVMWWKRALRTSYYVKWFYFVQFFRESRHWSHSILLSLPVLFYYIVHTFGMLIINFLFITCIWKTVYDFGRITKPTAIIHSKTIERDT